ncbi:Zinc finger protein 620 [Manis javanica]|nr:Zinc finger protein 620 [Manis javanica]
MAYFYLRTTTYTSEGSSWATGQGEAGWAAVKASGFPQGAPPRDAVPQPPLGRAPRGPCPGDLTETVSQGFRGGRCQPRAARDTTQGDNRGLLSPN